MPLNANCYTRLKCITSSLWRCCEPILKFNCYHGRPEGALGGAFSPLGFGDILLNVLIILILNNKWLW